MRRCIRNKRRAAKRRAMRDFQRAIDEHRAALPPHPMFTTDQIGAWVKCADARRWFSVKQAPADSKG